MPRLKCATKFLHSAHPKILHILSTLLHPNLEVILMIPSNNNVEVSEHDPALPWNNFPVYTEDTLPTFDYAENSEDGHNRVVASCTRSDEDMDTALNYDATNRSFPTQSPEILLHETLPSTIYHPDGEHTRDIDNSLPSSLDHDDSSNYENDRGNVDRAFIREDGLFYRTTKTIKQNSASLLEDDSHGNQSIPGAFQLNRRAPGSRPAWIRHGHAQHSRSSANPAANEEVRAATNYRVSTLEEVRDESNLLVILNHAEGNHGFSSVTESDSGSRRFKFNYCQYRCFILAGSSLLLFICAVGVTVGILISRQQNVSSPSELSCNEIYDGVSSTVYRSCLCTGAVKDWSIISNNEPHAISTYNSIVSKTSIKDFLTASYFNTTINEVICNVTNLSLLWLTEDVIKHEIQAKDWYQRFLLAHLYFTLTEKYPFNWKVQTNWLTAKSVCDWYGVRCDKEDNVVQLNLNSNTKTSVDEFPRSIFYLTSLLHLDLSGNDLNIGTIPSDIANLKNLQSLNLSANIVQGAIPFDFLSTSLSEFPSTAN
jgi:Leucine-rich repeat (LRR) protein